MFVEPAATPLTTPPALTVAMEVLLLAHTPPGVTSAKVVVPPAHTPALPVMAATVGSALTVNDPVLVISLQVAPVAVTVYEKDPTAVGIPLIVKTPVAAS